MTCSTGVFVELDLDEARRALQIAIAVQVPSIHEGAIAWAWRELDRGRAPRAVILAGDRSFRRDREAQAAAWIDVLWERARAMPNLRLVSGGGASNVVEKLQEGADRA